MNVRVFTCAKGFDISPFSAQYIWQYHVYGSIMLSYISLFKTPAWFDSWQTHLLVQVKWCLQNTCWSSDIIFAVWPLCGEEQHDQVSSCCSIYQTGCWLIEVSVLRDACAAICPLIFIISTDLCYEEQTVLVNRPFLIGQSISYYHVITLIRVCECQQICWNNCVQQQEAVSLKWS